MKYIRSNLIKNSSLAFVLSYILLHNIYLVIAGILLSIYELNKNSIKVYSTQSKEDNKNKKESDSKKSTETIINRKTENLKLVEEIEEIGFIPSINRKRNAA